MASSFADPDDFGDMLSLSDVAKLLGVHLGTARRYAREGVIPTHRAARTALLRPQGRTDGLHPRPTQRARGRRRSRTRQTTRPRTGRRDVVDIGRAKTASSRVCL